MAKASRSKKQPAFDANELADLIYSPAVGTGVGSHLLAVNHPEGKSHTGSLVRASSVAPALLPLLSARIPDPSVTTDPKDRHPEGNLHIGGSVEKIEDVYGAASAPTGTARAREQYIHPEGNLPIAVTHTQVRLVHEINNIDCHPEGNLPIGSAASEANTKDGQAIHPEGNLPLDLTSNEGVPTSTIETYPESHSHTGSIVLEEVPSTSAPVANTVGIELKSGRDDCTHPEGESPLGQAPEARPTFIPEASGRKTEHGQARYPQGQLPIGSSHPVGSLPAGQADLLDGSLVGRQQKIRRAVVAQDGHSSGEQLLYLSLWNAARPESPDTRVISIGYNGMSSLCKLERSNCKKNVQSLIEKLALEVTKAHQTASSTGTTYRIFSYGEILRRRKAAGLIWVIRTSGVRFVRPMCDSPTPPMGDLRTVSVSGSPIGGVGNTPTPPVCEAHTPLVKDRKVSEIASSSSVVYAALSRFGPVDDDVLHKLAISCRDAAPDCTDDEIVHFIREKAAIVRAGRISNPIGFFLTAVPKCFSGESFQRYREEQVRRLEQEALVAASAKREAEEWRKEQERLLVDPDVPDDHKALIREWLGIPLEQGAASPDSNP